VGKTEKINYEEESGFRKLFYRPIQREIARAQAAYTINVLLM